jgi:mono/diheme cytochrome c family protein
MKKQLAIALTGLSLFLYSCSSDPKAGQADETSQTKEAAAQAEEAPAASDKGVGPVSSVDLGSEIDQALVEKGKAIFEGKCAACHKFDQRYVGPALAGVTQRRKPEWIMNMILNPGEMVQQDETAKTLLGEYMTPMPNQNLTQEEARAVLEYFRTQNTK